MNDSTQKMVLIPIWVLQVLVANRGGIVVQVEGLRGFVPFSQVSAVSLSAFHDDEGERLTLLLCLPGSVSQLWPLAAAVVVEDESGRSDRQGNSFEDT